MYLLSCRVSGSNENSNFNCNCGDSESWSCTYDDPLPGMSISILGSVVPLFTTCLLP